MEPPYFLTIASTLLSPMPCCSLSEVVINGKDISKTITALTYEHRAGELPKLILEMVPGTLDIISNGCEVEVEEKP